MEKLEIIERISNGGILIFGVNDIDKEEFKCIIPRGKSY